MAIIISSISPGQVVIGGLSNGHLSSIELFPAKNACFIPDLPQPRSGHSVSILPGGTMVVCGGRNNFGYTNSCISWVTGNTSWVPIFNMR